MSDDLITAVVLRRGALSWTTLQRKKNRLDVVEHKTATFAWPAGVTDWQAPEITERLKPLCAQIKGRIAISLPTESALLRVVRLPTVEVDEIRDMAALQVDKFSPFPMDQMAVSQEILHQQEGASRVVVATAPLDAVARWGGVLQAAGCFAARDGCGHSGLVASAQAGEAGGGNRAPAAAADGGGRHRTGGGAGRGAGADAIPGRARRRVTRRMRPRLAEELNYTLTMLEAEWGLGGVSSLQLWSRGAVATDFLDRLRAESHLTLETHQLEHGCPR
jgi:hypothetical protein